MFTIADQATKVPPHKAEYYKSYRQMYAPSIGVVIHYDIATYDEEIGWYRAIARDVTTDKAVIDRIIEALNREQPPPDKLQSFIQDMIK